MSLANDNSTLFNAALALPREQRKELLEKLVISIDADEPKHPDYDRLWAEEIERRWEAYERGEVEMLDHDEVMKQLKDAVQRGRQCSS